jgi:hypothetical protein
VVDDDLRDQLRVRDDDEAAVPRADERVADAYGLDGSEELAHLDHVADVERAVGEQHHARDEVREHVFEREAEREARQA